VIGGVREGEAAALLRAFFEARRDLNALDGTNDD